jgi:hypothetical protein
MNKIVLEMNWSIGIVNIKLASVSAVLYPNPYSLRKIASFAVLWIRNWCGSSGFAEHIFEIEKIPLMF